jgi:hypothetical protein
VIDRHRAAARAPDSADAHSRRRHVVRAHRLAVGAAASTACGAVARGEREATVLAVLQQRWAGRVTACDDAGVVLAGSAFDATRPFTVDEFLAAGTYEIDPWILVGLHAR